MTAYDLALALDRTLADAVKAQKDALRLLQRARLQNVHLLAKISQAELQRPQVTLHVLPGDLTAASVQQAKADLAKLAKSGRPRLTWKHVAGAVGYRISGGGGASTTISRACAEGKHRGAKGKGYTCRRKWCQCLCHHEALAAGRKKSAPNERK